jgi:hypothetical protein
MAAFIFVSSDGVLLKNESERVGVYVPVAAPFFTVRKRMPVQ